MTLDSWGVLGRLILEEKGVYSAYYMVIFIFLMTYFFLNINLAFVVDNMTPNNTIALWTVNPNDNENNEENKNFFEVLAKGKVHDWIVNIVFLMSWPQIHTITKNNDFKGNLAIAFEISIDFIYTMGFMSRVLS
jgi:hypothetical protein